MSRQVSDRVAAWTCAGGFMVSTSRNRQASGSSRRCLARFGTVVLVVTTSLLIGATGGLDATFGDAGVTHFCIGNYGSCSSDVLQQASEKLVLAGYGARAGADMDFVVTRISATGARDLTFGDNGLAGADFAGLDDVAYAAIQQPDGKLVLVGRAATTETTSDIGLARFSADGAADAGFGTNGVVRIDVGLEYDRANDVVQQADGKLVVAGWTNASGLAQMVLARVTANGTLAPSFGTDGVAIVDFGLNLTSFAYALLLQPDGKLVAVGAVSDPPQHNPDFAIARLTKDGQLDTTFDGDGLVIVDIGGHDGAASVVAQ